MANKVTGFIKKSLVSGVETTLSTTHKGLYFTIMGVENLEMATMKRAYGILPEETRKKRRLASVNSHKKTVSKVKKAKEKCVNFFRRAEKGALEVIFEGEDLAQN